MDAIKTMIVRIDFDRRELSILPSVPEDIGDPIPLSYDELGMPSMRLEVGIRGNTGMPASALFGIDTGNFSRGSGEVELQLFESLLNTDALTAVDHGKYETLVSEGDERIARLAQLRLGSFQHSGLIVSDGLRNQLSLAYLSRYRVIFDFPHDRMYLSPGEHFDEADFHDLSGLHLVHIGGDVVIESIDKDGAGDKAGLLKGDVVVEIGGTPAQSFSSLELARAFGRPSNRSISVRRPGIKLLKTIELGEDSEHETSTTDQANAADNGARSGAGCGVEEKQTFRIAKHGNPIVLPVEIGPEHHPFLFDTGTLVSSFDKSLMPLLLGPAGPRRMHAQSSMNEQGAERSVAPLLYVGRRKLTGVTEVTCVDQEPLRGALGERFDGVLGMDAIKELIVQFDFDQGTLSILPTVPEDMGEPIKLALCTGGQRAIDLGWLNEDPGLFVIDTGCASPASGTLNARRFQALLDSRQATLIADALAPPAARSRKVRVAAFSLGEFHHSDLIFSEGRYNTLALGYLSRYLVTIDFTRGRMYLKPSARFNAQ